MDKTVLYRIFKLGRIPKRYASALQDEGIVLLEEGIGGTVTFVEVRGPGRYHSWKRSWFVGSLAITEKTFAAFKMFRPLIYLPLTHENVAKLNCTLESSDILMIRTDASLVNDQWTGDIECRLKTSKAKMILEKLTKYAV